MFEELMLARLHGCADMLWDLSGGMPVSSNIMALSSAALLGISVCIVGLDRVSESNSV